MEDQTLNRRNLLKMLGIGFGTGLVCALSMEVINEIKKINSRTEIKEQMDPLFGKWKVISIDSEDLKDKRYTLELTRDFYRASIPGFLKYGKYFDTERIEKKGKSSSSREGNIDLYEFPYNPSKSFLLVSHYTLDKNELILNPFDYRNIINPPKEIVFVRDK